MRDAAVKIKAEAKQEKGDHNVLSQYHKVHRSLKLGQAEVRRTQKQ